ncbi:MAG TPA: glycosyltransferase family A protein [candidate division Zixibacteria bacterium]|nr:glycosyltransferase family A protein [candidate division Zixibacteria bacterium]
MSEPREPRVCVVIPARNEEVLLPGALRSVAEQTLPAERVEVVVAVNGTTDRTAEIAERMGRECTAAGGPTVRVIQLPRPGVARAKNAGVAAAIGELIVFLDADSRMSSNLLEEVVARAARGERAASIRIVADGDDLLDRAFFLLIEHGKRIVGTRANLFWCDRALFTALGGFDERLNHAEDLDFLVRARRAGVRVGHITRAWIATSPRRLHRLPLRLGMLTMLGRWALGHVGIGRTWPYSGGGE